MKAMRSSVLHGICLALALTACEPAVAPTPITTPVVTAPPGFAGQVRISLFGSSAQAQVPATHSTTFVPGPAYDAMEDNDIRGFLDGRFKWAWNQPGQVHVRVGRRAENPKYGELELFRVLQRWADLSLPAHTDIQQAELSMQVEAGPAVPVRVYLYAVNKDWQPGLGGTQRNNVSPPAPGEVWWGAVAQGREDWALPGAGFASDQHPDADTPARPLAQALYQPGAQGVTWSGPGLAGYIQERLRLRQPLLFLIKLADHDEDTAATVLTLYSANHGDDRNLSRRPRLHLLWSSRAEQSTQQERLQLEYGRGTRLWRISKAAGRYVSISVEREADALAPVVDVRGRTPAGATRWVRYHAPFPSYWDELEVRVRALRDPVALGTDFMAGLRDTWVTSAAPEQQRVLWHFHAPSGEHHEVTAQYVGEYRWTVRFRPGELGPWRYYWEQQFDGPFRSAAGVFDVTAADSAAAHRHLQLLLQELRAAPAPPDGARLQRYMGRFARLERAAVGLLGPAAWRGEEGAALRQLLDEVRAALAGTPPPRDPPMRPNPAFPWQQEQQQGRQ